MSCSSPARRQSETAAAIATSASEAATSPSEIDTVLTALPRAPPTGVAPSGAPPPPPVPPPSERSWAPVARPAAGRASPGRSTGRPAGRARGRSVRRPPWRARRAPRSARRAGGPPVRAPAPVPASRAAALPRIAWRRPERESFDRARRARAAAPRRPRAPGARARTRRSRPRCPAPARAAGAPAPPAAGARADRARARRVRKSARRPRPGRPVGSAAAAGSTCRIRMDPESPLLPRRSRGRAHAAPVGPRAPTKCPRARRSNGGGLRELWIQRIAFGKRPRPLRELRLLRLGEVSRQGLADHPADLAEVVDLESPGGERGGADPEPRRDGRRPRVERHRVAVDGDAHLGETVLALLAVELGVAQIRQQQVDVRAAGQHVDARREHLLRHHGRALARAPLPLPEGLGLSDLERHRLPRDHVHQRAALVPGEDARVDLLRVILLAE